jgi:hypothetical protein
MVDLPAGKGKAEASTGARVEQERVETPSRGGGRWGTEQGPTEAVAGVSGQ